MAMSTGIPEHERRTDTDVPRGYPRRWSLPTARTLAAASGALSLIGALTLLLGSTLGFMLMPMAFVPWAAGLGAAGLLGVIHLVLALAILGGAWALPSNAFLHGALLVLWGVLGIFVGLGLWVGALLAIVAGVLGVVTLSRRRAASGRRPTV